MDYVDIEFPRRIARGAMREPGWSTALVSNFGGYDQANINWVNAKHRYDVSLAIRTETDYSLVLEHFHSVRGRAKSFPFRDPLDNRVEASNGVLIDNGESPAGDFQLAKRYGTGANLWDRWITRPVTVTVYRLRAGVTTDITGSCTISTDTGRATIAGGGVYEPTTDTLSWSGSFVVPVRYDSDQLPAVVEDRQPDHGELLVRCDSITLVEVRPASGDGQL